MSKSRSPLQSSLRERVLSLLNEATQPRNLAALAADLGVGETRDLRRVGTVLHALHSRGDAERSDKQPAENMLRPVYHYTITERGRERLQNAARHRATAAALPPPVKSPEVERPAPTQPSATRRPQREPVRWREQHVWDGLPGGVTRVLKYPVYAGNGGNS